TGLTNVATDLTGKRLELLKENVPSMTRTGFIWYPTDPGGGVNFKAIETTARTLGLESITLEGRNRKEVDDDFKTATERHVHALAVQCSGLFNAHRTRITELVTKVRLPSMFSEAAYVEAGGLMYYGPNTPDLYRRAAVYVDKILKGAKPADLPVEQPMKFEFIINLSAAKQIDRKSVV